MQGQKTILSMGKTDHMKSLIELQTEERTYLLPSQIVILDTDFSLDAMQLDDKYNPEGDGEHPVFVRAQWREAVANRDTISSYWEWLEQRVAQHHALV